MMYSAYKLNKQGDNIQPWCTPFPIWNQPVVPCLVLTVASWPAYRFLKRQVRWSAIPISFRIFQFIVIHTVEGFGIVNKAEINVFLELSCFFYEPTDIDNLISGSSAFSKASLNIWKFTVVIQFRFMLKPGLENFEHYFASMWDESNCVVVWAFFGIALLWDWNENWPFPVLWPLLSFPHLLAYWVQHSKCRGLQSMGLQKVRHDCTHMQAKAEVDVFLELSCFFDDPADAGNLISGSSAFSEKSLNIWKFMVHILLKPGLENVEHYFTSV